MDAGTIYSLLQMLLVKPEHRLSGHRKAEMLVRGWAMGHLSEVVD